MNVPEGDIIEWIKCGDIDVSRIADERFLGIGARRAGDELMRDENIHALRLNRHGGNGGFDRVGIGFNLRVRMHGANGCGAHEREKIKIEPSVQRNRLNRAGIDRGNVNAARVHQPAGES